MGNVTFPRNGIPIGYVSINGQRMPVEVHPEYLRAFDSIVERVGGVSGSSTNDLTLSQFEDAGIEEHKHALFRLTDDVWQLPPMVDLSAAHEDKAPGVEELRALVAELTKAVEALQQGLTA